MSPPAHREPDPSPHDRRPTPLKKISALTPILSADAREMGSHQVGDFDLRTKSSGYLSCCLNHGMPKFTSLAFVLALTIGLIASLPRPCAEGSDRVSPAVAGAESTCGDQYNALLTRAKDALNHGDRSGAFASLYAAKAKLRVCEEREQRNSTAAIAVAMNCR